MVLPKPQKKLAQEKINFVKLTSLPLISKRSDFCTLFFTQDSCSQWVGPNGERRGPNDSAPDTGIAEKRDRAYEAKENVKQQGREAADRAQREGQAHGQEARDRMQSATSSAPGDNSNTPSQAEREAAQREGQQLKEEKKDQAKNVASDKYNQMKDRIPQEHKDRAREYRDRSKVCLFLETVASQWLIRIIRTT